jgi:hypothetical protein
MATLNPTLSGGIGFEQAVEQPSALAGVANLANVFVSATRPVKQERPTESMLKEQALRPFAERVAQLRNSDLTDAQFTREFRRLHREQLVQTPQYRPDLAGIASDYGVTDEVLEVPVEDSFASMMNDYASSTEGQSDLLRSVTLNDDGSLDEEATNTKFRQFAAENLAERAHIERSNRELTAVQNDNALWKARSEQSIQSFSSQWTVKSQGIADSLVKSALAGQIEVDTPEEQLAYLRNARRVLVDEYRSKAQAAGVHPEVYRSALEEAVSPIDNLINTMVSMAGDTETVLSAFRNAKALEAETMLYEALGPLSQNSEFMRQAFVTLGVQLYNQETFKTTLQGLVQMSNEGARDGLSLLPNLPSDPGAAVTTEVVDPSVVDQMVQNQRNDSSYLSTRLDTAITLLDTANDVTNPKIQQEIFRDFGNIVAASEAADRPLSEEYLSRIFGPKNVRKLTDIANSSGTTGTDLKSAIAYFSAKQITRNRAVLDRNIALVAGYTVIHGREKTYLYNAQGEEVSGRTYVAGGGNSQLEAIFRSVKNINIIKSAANRVGISEFVTQDNPDVPGPAAGPEAIQEYLDSIGVNSGGNSAGGTGVAPRMLELIDRTEGGADYNTLFEFSNREGREFSGTKVSEMTIGELEQFADGPYGEWSKGRLGYKATPMGRYQFVGDTLTAVADRMGLSNNTVFTPEVQDAMFHFYAKERLATATTPAQKRKVLREGWEGFKKVSDRELDLAIAEFEGTEPPSYVDLQRDSRNMQTAPGISLPPRARGRHQH